MLRSKEILELTFYGENMNFARLLTRVLIAACGTALLTAPVRADTCAQADNLLACAHVSHQSCRASVGCVGDIQQALSVQDVLERAAVLCCTQGTSSSCLTRFANRLQRVNRGAPVIMKSFIRKAREEVLALANNGCDTGSLGDI
jgi:hypothetical protein